MVVLFSKRAARVVVLLYTVVAVIGLLLALFHPSIVAQVMYTPTVVIATYMSMCIWCDWGVESVVNRK